MTSGDRDAVPAEPRSDGTGLDDQGTESRSSRSQSSAPPAAKKTRKRKQLPIWQETVLLLVIALVLAVVIKAFFVQAFYIPSQSMEPGLIENDRILVQKVSYWGDGGPERGDVVVFKDPGEWLTGDTEGPQSLFSRGLAKIGLYPSGGHLVKRVIGVAGDAVTCCDERGRLSVNGVALDEEDYVMSGGQCAAPGSAQGACELEVGPIPEGYLLVMGDNRGNSSDSTAHLCTENQTDCPPTRGLVRVDDVVGKVFALVWPRDRFTRVKRPDVFEDVPEQP